jgi:peptidoglycan hydrolase-like amidase
MKKQTLYKFSLEQLAVAAVIISLAFTLRFIGDNFSQHPITKNLIDGIFSKAQAAEAYPELSRRVGYQAEIIEQSNYVVNILPDKGITFSIKVKNTGNSTWPRDGAGFFYIKSTQRQSQFKHIFWLDNNTPIRSSTAVAPGETVTLKFALQAPPTTGLFVENFVLAFDNNSPIPGSMFELPINITLHPQGSYTKPQVSSATVSQTTKAIEPVKTIEPETSTTNNIQSPPPTNTVQSTPLSPSPKKIAGITNSNVIKQLPLLESEPEISVGLYYAENKTITVTADGEFTAFSDNIKLGHYGAGTFVKVQYISGVYNLILPSGTASLNHPIVFKPLNESTILELPDYERRVAWNSSINDNRFKGNIEVKYNPRTGNFWAINELPFETYVEGIDETSNIDVPEFHKTLAVAARTYALFHLLDNTRYKGFFHVDDNNDQIYRGYNASRRLTHYVSGVKETAGQVITLNDQVVVTPYFTQSDGQTKSYQSVWGNGGGLEISHLQAVSVPQDVGRTMLGHGVGMSAQGAKRMAELDDLDYQTILQHFYSGVDISKVY